MATIVKSKLGVEDVHRDTLGTGETVQTPTSSGGFRSVRKFNASHVPITETTRAITKAGGSASTATDVDARLQEVATDLTGIGIPDDVTVEVNSGALRVKDGGISGAKLASSVVTEAKIGTGAVTEAKIGTGAVTAVKLDTDAVTTIKIQDDAVTADKIADNTITADQIATDTITGDKLVDTPVSYPVACEEVTFPGGGASGTVAVTTALTTDKCIVTVKSMTNAAYLRSAEISTTNTVLFTFSENPGSTELTVLIMRATT